MSDSISRRHHAGTLCDHDITVARRNFTEMGGTGPALALAGANPADILSGCEEILRGDFQEGGSVSPGSVVLAAWPHPAGSEGTVRWDGIAFMVHPTPGRGLERKLLGLVQQLPRPQGGWGIPGLYTCPSSGGRVAYTEMDDAARARLFSGGVRYFVVSRQSLSIPEVALRRHLLGVPEPAPCLGLVTPADVSASRADAAQRGQAAKALLSQNGPSRVQGTLAHRAVDVEALADADPRIEGHIATI